LVMRVKLVLIDDCDCFCFYLYLFFFFFFFSSRRRHTRFSRDWSSDVCSSDLQNLLALFLSSSASRFPNAKFLSYQPLPTTTFLRSEERRVGKECRSRWSPYH